jgi:ABC-2 type transport system permease protein
MTSLKHTWYMTLRHLRALARQPWYIAFTLVQPMIYLLLFGALFQKITGLGHFGTADYIAYLTPGIVVMTAMFSGGWSGMGMVFDLDRGVMDRFLVSPVRRGSLINGRVAQGAIVAAIQALIILGVGLVRGARFDGGPLGVLALIASAVLLAAPFIALSNATALMVRKEESVIGAVNFILLPLTFTSSVFMAKDLMPGWMQTVARFNPANWAVEAARDAALQAHPDWGSIGTHLGLLAAFTVVAVGLATRAFRAYQRSV